MSDEFGPVNLDDEPMNYLHMNDTTIKQYHQIEQLEAENKALKEFILSMANQISIIVKKL